jgi:hypothetical protein
MTMTRANMRQHGMGPLLHRATGGAMEAPPCITFSRWRTLTPALFQDTRHGPATKVWDETEFLNLPGPAEGRHHCRWRQAAGQPPSTTLKSRHAVAAVCYPSAAERELIEQNERLQNCINFNDSTTIEPAKRRSVLQRTGIGNPRRQDRPLFRRC